MATYKVDRVHLHFSYTTNLLTLWLFNDDSFYAEKSLKRVARYSFNRHPGDRRIKLEKGIFAAPYKDGWKYTINEKLHPILVETIYRYNDYGFTTNEDGEEVPFTYLRHNRKAVGIHHLIARYINRYDENTIYIEGIGRIAIFTAGALITPFSDQFKQPYFPTEFGDGRNHARWL